MISVPCVSAGLRHGIPVSSSFEYFLCFFVMEGLIHMTSVTDPIWYIDMGGALRWHILSPSKKTCQIILDWKRFTPCQLSLFTFSLFNISAVLTRFKVWIFVLFPCLLVHAKNSPGPRLAIGPYLFPPLVLCFGVLCGGGLYNVSVFSALLYWCVSEEAAITLLRIELFGSPK